MFQKTFPVFFVPPPNAKMVKYRHQVAFNGSVETEWILAPDRYGAADIWAKSVQEVPVK